jgi:uncharacterized protein with HEPN domain
MRNIIAHDYGEVDIELVWQTAEADLPRLIEVLERYFATRGPERDDEERKQAGYGDPSLR